MQPETVQGSFGSKGGGFNRWLSAVEKEVIVLFDRLRYDKLAGKKG